LKPVGVTRPRWGARRLLLKLAIPLAFVVSVALFGAGWTLLGVVVAVCVVTIVGVALFALCAVSIHRLQALSPHHEKAEEMLKSVGVLARRGLHAEAMAAFVELRDLRHLHRDEPLVAVALFGGAADLVLHCRASLTSADLDGLLDDVERALRSPDHAIWPSSDGVVASRVCTLLLRFPVDEWGRRARVEMLWQLLRPRSSMARRYPLPHQFAERLTHRGR
jgi:hypothetical protein